MTYIYGIYDKSKDIILYIGSTDDTGRRFKQHSTSLQKGRHCNKTLQKYYDKNCESIEDLEFRILYEVNTDNSLIRYFLEMLCISLHRPICNKCVVSMGNNRVCFARCGQDIADQLINVIIKNK